MPPKKKNSISQPNSSQFFTKASKSIKISHYIDLPSTTVNVEDLHQTTTIPNLEESQKEFPNTSSCTYHHSKEIVARKNDSIESPKGEKVNINYSRHIIPPKPLEPIKNKEIVPNSSFKGLKKAPYTTDLRNSTIVANLNDFGGFSACQNNDFAKNDPNSPLEKANYMGGESTKCYKHHGIAFNRLDHKNDILFPSISTKLTPLEAQIEKIKQDNPDVLLVVEVNYIYKFYSKDAEIASKVLGIECHQNKNFVTCSIFAHSLMLSVRKLVYAGYKVGVVNMAETAAIKSASLCKNGLFLRKLSSIYTRGTLIGEVAESNSKLQKIDNNLLDPGDLGYIVSIVDSEPIDLNQNVIIGLIAVNLSTGSVIYDEFKDSYSRFELETRFAHLNPVEFVFDTGLSNEFIAVVNSIPNLKNCRIEKFQKISFPTARKKVIDEFLSLNAYIALEQVEMDLNDQSIVALEILLRYLKQYDMENVFCSNGIQYEQKHYQSILNQILFCTELNPDNTSKSCLQIDHQTLETNTEPLNKVFTSFLHKKSMYLDARTLHSLQIIDKYKTDYISNHSDCIISSNYTKPKNNFSQNLFQLLNNTITPLGKRTLLSWLQKPLIDSQEINYRLQIVEDITKSEIYISSIKKDKNKSTEFDLNFGLDFNNLNKENNFEKAFAWLLCKVKLILNITIDLETGLAGIRHGKANPSDAVKTINSFYVITSVFAEIKGDSDLGMQSQLFMDQIMKTISCANPVLKSLLQIVLFKRLFEFVRMMGNCINTNAAQKLDWINLFDLNAQQSYDDFEKQNNENRLIFENKDKYNSADVSFTNTDFSKTYSLWSFNLKKHKEKYLYQLQNLKNVWNSETEFLKIVNLQPKSVLGVDVIFQGKGILHPILFADHRINLVPNDIELRVRPNMGGKSTYIKTIGLMAVMAQIGCFVPARELKLTPLDAIYTRIGAYDMILKNQSTFMVEMRETKILIEKATSRSLVILDELGRGTNTNDGSAIACATLEYLLNRDLKSDKQIIDLYETSDPSLDPCVSFKQDIPEQKNLIQPLILFVTHYNNIIKYFKEPEYKNIVKPCYVDYIRSTRSYIEEIESRRLETRSYNNPITQNIINLSNSYNEEIVFLYKVVEGVSDDSYGIQVAKMAGLPQDKKSGSKGGAKVVIEPHRHEGIFIARGKEDLLVTKNLVPGESVYGEKRISVEGADGLKTEYRVWNPFRSKIAAGILGGLDNIHIAPGKKVLYLGAASGTTVSHVADIVGPSGVVYAVEFSHRSGRDLINMAKKRTNVVPIVEDARYPLKYRMLVPMVDVVFADVAQPDQARIICLNAHSFLKNGGHIVISIKANCIDSTVDAAIVFAREVKKMQEEGIKPREQLTLEPYERDHAIVIGEYRSNSK
ncbi:hypothetical protein BB561_001186 [Smittium simulii]|uniref:rRNA 2'-O-methyltransferase fibrillarin n=1 Tax=Smittium simulii TaxID=133385 RepID=A0A2T9YVN7_9FUNG|nr:hypothetical protein BB561_001186 [Smittium simulii]